MNEIKDIIAENIVYLRKSKKWTQVELAEKLSYTDKAISKWERAESMPDVDSLYALANLFGVTVDYFFHPISEDKTTFIADKNKFKIKDFLILCLFCISVIFLALVIFIFAWSKNNQNIHKYWVAFVWIAPLCSLFCWFYFKRIQNLLGRLISSSALLWSLLASIYLSMLVNNSNFWMMFLVGIPLQGVLVILLLLKNKS